MEESQSRLSSKFSLKKFIEFAVIVVITAVIWNIPQGVVRNRRTHGDTAEGHSHLRLRHTVMVDGGYPVMGHVPCYHHIHVSYHQ